MSVQQLLSAEEMQHFVEQGYVVARGVLDLELDIRPVVAEYEAKLDEVLTTWQEEGLLEYDFRELSFAEKIIRIASETELDYSQPLDISFPQSNLKETTPIHNGPAIFNLLRSPRLLDIVEQFIGPEIYSNPVQHVRIKPPEHCLLADYGSNALITRTPWHQDLGVIDEEADESNILTVWMPMTDATVENGCMAVVPGTNHGELALHCPVVNSNLTIPDDHIPDGSLPLPMQPGDVLFMSSKTMHTSLRNISDGIRWSFDLRYNPIGDKTGRPWFPGFIARSQQNPESELHNHEVWGQLWADARQKIARNGDPDFNRWDADAPGCA